MELLIGILAAWGIVMLFWTAVGVMYMPLRRRRDLCLTVLIHGRDDESHLIQYLKGLLWLRNMGIAWWNIVVVRDDLTPEASEMVEEIARKESHVALIERDRIRNWTDM